LKGYSVDYSMVLVRKSGQVEEFFRFSAGRCKIEADLSLERISAGLLISSQDYPVLIFAARHSMNPASSNRIAGGGNTAAQEQIQNGQKIVPLAEPSAAFLQPVILSEDIPRSINFFNHQKPPNPVIF
jgi:hypothetical protein